MGWSPQQDKALLAVSDWFKNRRHEQQVFRLFGYAGTGKTTLAQHFAEEIDGKVLFLAFTGKACKVLMDKGCAPVSTIHSALFNPQEPDRNALKELEDQIVHLRKELIEEYKGDSKTEEELMARVEANDRLCDLYTMLEVQRKVVSKPSFTYKEHNDLSSCALGIVDECSMINNELGQALIDAGVPLLVMGDPAQLPPVEGNGFFTEGDNPPDVLLTEVHRQAEDNPIIWMATKTRNQEEIPLGNYGDSRYIDMKDLDFGTIAAADQNICGTNALRHKWNRRIRHLLYGPDSFVPVPEEKMIALRNDKEADVINGAMFTTKKITFVGEESIHMTVWDDEYNEKDVQIHSKLLSHPYEEMSYWDRRTQTEMDYGHCITGHKSQGSQWQDVVAVDESSVFRRDKWKWKYTVLTRAANKITLVKRNR